MLVNITKSTRAGKKMMAIFYDEAKRKVKTTHFGASGYESYPDHQDLQPADFKGYLFDFCKWDMIDHLVTPSGFGNKPAM